MVEAEENRKDGELGRGGGTKYAKRILSSFRLDNENILTGKKDFNEGSGQFS